MTRTHRQGFMNTGGQRLRLSASQLHQLTRAHQQHLFKCRIVELINGQGFAQFAAKACPFNLGA